jgi:hypothetical protein
MEEGEVAAVEQLVAEQLGNASAADQLLPPPPPTGESTGEGVTAHDAGEGPSRRADEPDMRHLTRLATHSDPRRDIPMRLKRGQPRPVRRGFPSLR